MAKFTAGINMWLFMMGLQSDRTWKKNTGVNTLYMFWGRIRICSAKPLLRVSQGPTSTLTRNSASSGSHTKFWIGQRDFLDSEPKKLVRTGTKKLLVLPCEMSKPVSKKA